jgi:hypothetical protein
LDETPQRRSTGVSLLFSPRFEELVKPSAEGQFILIVAKHSRIKTFVKNNAIYVFILIFVG